MKTVSVLCVTLLYVIGQVSAAKIAVVCPQTTYDWLSTNLNYRYDEVSRYDCPTTRCGGGQCVALVKCNCGAPQTSLWSPGISVSEFCESGTGYIEPGTAIATFKQGKYKGRNDDHTAIFLGCTGHGNFQVIEQACAYSTRLREFFPTSYRSLYNNFRVIMTDGVNLNPHHNCISRYIQC